MKRTKRMKDKGKRKNLSAKRNSGESTRKIWTSRWNFRKSMKKNSKRFVSSKRGISRHYKQLSKRQSRKMRMRRVPRQKTRKKLRRPTMNMNQNLTKMSWLSNKPLEVKTMKVLTHTQPIPSKIKKTKRRRIRRKRN